MREEQVQVKVPEPISDATSHTTSTRHRNVASASRHAAKCRICNHPDRAAIEFDFLNWRNPADLVKSYHFRSLSTIYRHAHATGLFARRRLNLRFALERIVERVGEVPVTATSVIRAARAITHINDSGQWVDPPTRIIVEHINAAEPAVPKDVASSFSSTEAPAASDMEAGSARSSSRARQGGQGCVLPSLRAVRSQGTAELVPSPASGAAPTRLLKTATSFFRAPLEPRGAAATSLRASLPSCA